MKISLGQYFTPDNIVDLMCSLTKNKGSVLEPSCGGGAFSDRFDKVVAVEYDPTVCPKYAINCDFFTYSLDNKFDTVIGNPPYVRFQDIVTKDNLLMNLFDRRTNLYAFFIYKSILHLSPAGELIFIVPREFLFATSNLKLNTWLHERGTITDIIDVGDQPVFEDATLDCIIFRYELGNLSLKTNDGRKFVCNNGHLLFLTGDYDGVRLGDLFDVKVGAVSGCDKAFIHNDGIPFVCSTTVKDGKTRRMLYNKYHPYLDQYKDILLARGIKKFNKDNWYMWGRNYYVSDKPRIYVNCKTRQLNPFFLHDCKSYDGSVLALIPKQDINLNKAVEVLNNMDWEELGMKCGGRFIFTQRLLSDCNIPTGAI